MVVGAPLVGAWALGERIGGGGQAVVYRALHAERSTPAALKLFHRSVWADDAFRARFRREREALATVRHPRIVPMLDSGEHDGRGYLVMALAREGSLAERLVRGPVGPAEALALLAGVAAALDAAHRAGVLHRDVTPHNVLLDPDGPWLADFGIARRLDATALTGEGLLVGTAGYLAPEVITGERALPAADRYALAVMAFEVLTGSRPFRADGLAGLLYAHVSRTPPRASSLRPALPREVDAVLARGLAKDPGDRPSSAAALVDGLAAALGVTDPDATRLTPRTRRRRRAARLVPLALVAAGIVAAGGATAALTVTLGRGDAPPPAAAVMVPAAPPLTVPGPAGELPGERARAEDLPGVTLRAGAAAAGIGPVRIAATTGGWGDLWALRNGLATRVYRVEPLLAGTRSVGLIATRHADLTGVGERWAMMALADAGGRRAVIVHGTGDGVLAFARRVAAAPERSVLPAPQ